ncbi:MAG: hypothetical protein H0X41_01100 [Chitinophagaceae bacterium]|nr:hypothetical protein [Chitinophagaceae bacterium]
MSCQKEISSDIPGQTTPNNLLGTWKFINSHVTTNSNVEITDVSSDVKTITLSDYVTSNNQGILQFNDSLMITTGVSYDVSATAQSYTYDNGNLDDSTDFPFSFSLPASSSSSAYKRIGTDSIYAPGGTLTQVAGATGMLSASGGYKYKLTGDTLLLTMMVNQSLVDTSFGFPITSTDKATVITTLSKQ